MEVVQKIKNIAHGIFPVLSLIRYGKLGSKIKVIGITGTDGKSSSVILIAAMLRQAGHKVAHFSSISFNDGLSEEVNSMKMTTPGMMQLHKFLDKAINNGCEYAVLEITSQGILQHRHKGIGFSLVGITNITEEHIEAHGSFNNYMKTKVSLTRSLLSHNQGVVISKDLYLKIKNILPHNVEKIILGENNTKDFFTMSYEKGDPFQTVLTVEYEKEKVTVQTQLAGPFIFNNLVFASRIALLYGVPLSVVASVIQSMQKIPGRFEVLSREPLVIVDYAHTINALSILLPYVRKHTKGKLIHIFGAAGGGRDKYKRPLIANISESSADISILTEENSFDEPTPNILNDIIQGFSQDHQVYRKEQREDAVIFGLSMIVSKHDTLLLTAKGSETVIAGPHRTKRPYNERLFVQCLLEKSSFV